MEDKITLERIKLLHPKIRNEVEHIYRSQIVPALTGRAICRFAYTLRTFEEQANLFAQGRTRLFDSNGRRLGIVTQSNAGQSIHNYGLALDIILLVDNNKDGRYETGSYETTVDYDGDKKADWMEVVSIFKSAGWTWGGDWKRFRDAPHFEKPLGHTWRTLKAKWDKKDFIPGTTYVRI
jgi:peptidoglycan L-alanyl-D-glutamate endopeptidase CwlK